MCPPEREPPAVMRLLTPAATKRSMTQNAAFVPGHKIGQFLHRIFIECLARVGGRNDQPIERQVAVLGLSLNCSSHGESPISVESRVRAQAGTPQSAPAQDLCISWPLRIAQAPSPVPRFLLRG